MAQCKWCRKAGWLQRIDDRGLCAECQRTVPGDIDHHCRMFSLSYGVVKQSRDMAERLEALASLEINVRSLLPYADRGISTLDPGPQEVLAEVEEMRRRIIEDGALELVPIPSSIKSKERVPRRRKSRQARITTKSRLLFLDVETTGLSVDDRIVSLGMARIHAADLLKTGSSGSHAFNADIVHLVFNPERPNHPAAQRVHGWSDDILARQPRFAAHASTVLEMLEGSDVWLAHNISFDLRFIDLEFKRLDRSPVRRSTFCTMEKAKSEWRGETSRLDHCIGRIGLKRSGERHGALEDAVLCAALFTYFRTGRTLASLPECPMPSNLAQ